MKRQQPIEHDWRIRELQAAFDGGKIPKLSLKTFAKANRVSPKWLGRLFKRATGASFCEYARGARMQVAQSLLLRSDMSVKQVALTLGYRDTGNFCHDFKRYYGVTPRTMAVTTGKTGHGVDGMLSASRAQTELTGTESAG